MKQMNKQLSQSIDFLELIYRLQRITRRNYANGEDRRENDVEHSYQLAMCAWYLNDRYELGLDNNLLIKYSLVHDLPEAYAGDTPSYDAPELLATKKEREVQAIKQLTSEYSDSFPSLISTLEEYEYGVTNESKFVYELDKLISVIGVYLENGKTWKEDKTAKETLINNKNTKIKSFELLNNIWEQLKLKLEEGELFYKS
jgi:putative hydrolases of HD superfamily